MKIDMSSAAITLRLKQVEQLRQVCLALAGSSFALQIRQKYSANKSIQRTSQAIGR
jgi:hypothetical protein